MLIEPEIKEEIPDFGPSEWVYARFVLLRSLLVLKSVQAIRLPDDLEDFVERVYGIEPLAIPIGWQAALDESERALDEARRIQRRKAKGVMILRPDDEDLLRHQNAQLDEDDPEAAARIRAATRDTEPTMQLILVYQVNGADFLDIQARQPFSDAEKPDLAAVRKLLDNEVTVSHRGCVAYYAGRSAPSGWRERGILRNHRVVRLDRCGQSQPTEYAMQYDREIGVRFTRDPAERAD
jgi:hypothetical protein